MSFLCQTTPTRRHCQHNFTVRVWLSTCVPVCNGRSLDSSHLSVNKPSYTYIDWNRINRSKRRTSDLISQQRNSDKCYPETAKSERGYGALPPTSRAPWTKLVKGCQEGSRGQLQVTTAAWNRLRRADTTHPSLSPGELPDDRSRVNSGSSLEHPRSATWEGFLTLARDMRSDVNTSARLRARVGFCPGGSTSCGSRLGRRSYRPAPSGRIPPHSPSSLSILSYPCLTIYCVFRFSR